MSNFRVKQQLISRVQVLDILGVSDATMRRWQRDYGLPRPCAGNRYSRAALEKWLKRCEDGEVLKN